MVLCTDILSWFYIISKRKYIFNVYYRVIRGNNPTLLPYLYIDENALEYPSLTPVLQLDSESKNKLLISGKRCQKISGDLYLTGRDRSASKVILFKMDFSLWRSHGHFSNQNGVIVPWKQDSYVIYISMQPCLRGKIKMISGKDMHDSTPSKRIIFREHRKGALLRSIMHAKCIHMRKEHCDKVP